VKVIYVAEFVHLDSRSCDVRDEIKRKYSFIFIIFTSQIVEILLRNGANVNVQDSLGATPLHRAASKGISPVVSLLLNRNEIQVDITDKYGNTPL
jgi:hypothetical protein